MIWLRTNKLSLNVEKTHFMLFCSRGKQISNDVKIFIDNTEISQVTTTKFLGVIIDNKLDWKYHIDHICNKVSKNIGIILKARKVFDKSTLIALYYSMIYPYLTYCIQIWGATYNKYIDKLFLLQKKIIRIICGVPRLTHTEPLFIENNIMKVDDLYVYNVTFLCTN